MRGDLEIVGRQSKKKIGFVFPAFAMKFVGSFSTYQDEVDKFLPSALKLVPIDLRRFEEMANGIIEDELQAHYFCYINSCVVSKILKGKKIGTDYVGGYSMGLYGGLYHSNVVSFEKGLLLMDDIYRIALDSIDEKKYGMGVIVGLTYESVEKLIHENCENVDIIDVSNELVINVTGIYDEVVKLVEIAGKQAINTKMLPITLPYHSRFMKDAVHKIRDHLTGVELEAPRFPIISCVNQKILSSVDDVKDELYCNVNQRINWFMTMKKMLELNTNLFVECGMSKSLTQLAKFVGGDFEIYDINKLSKRWVLE
jgi:[acyl-carrier-protein] S-malonyltransferase